MNLPLLFAEHSAPELAMLGLCLFLLGMTKGGFPVGSLALPLMILAWPQQTGAARSAVSFMLPLLCTMDVIAMFFYFRHVQWNRVQWLLPGTLIGVAVASLLFVSDQHALLAVSDRALKLCIGILGLIFCFWQFLGSRILGRIQENRKPGRGKSALFGFTAGLTSTMAHAAGPVMQMYLLPQRLPKKEFAATNCAYFFLLNLIKLLPFTLLGRIRAEHLQLGAALFPVIPFGVFAGWLIVHRIRPEWYRRFIGIVLFCTSLLLILKSL